MNPSESLRQLTLTTEIKEQIYTNRRQYDSQARIQNENNYSIDPNKLIGKTFRVKAVDAEGCVNNNFNQMLLEEVK